LADGTIYDEKLSGEGLPRVTAQTIPNAGGDPRQQHVRMLRLDNTSSQLAPGHTVFVIFQKSSGYRQLHNVRDAFASLQKYHLNPDHLRSNSGLSVNPVLAPTGSNLVAVLDYIVAYPGRGPILAVEKALRESVPSIDGIYLPVTSSQPAQKALEYSLAGNGQALTTIPAALASEGVLLLTAFLALAYSNTPEILLVEEPENGLHPSRLKQVVELLRDMSSGKDGNKARQIIVTTHSPILLNYVDPDEVRIFRRDKERGTVVLPMSKAPNLDKLRKDYGTGELWYLLGEEGLFEEVPA